jgi:ribonuclease HI
VVVVEAVRVWAPDELGVDAVSNNQTELLAIIEGANHLLLHHDPHKGAKAHVEVCSDSQMALGWMFQEYKTSALPDPIAIALFQMQVERLLTPRYTWSPNQHAGHPTKADLERGFRLVNNYCVPVSEHNVWCDKACFQAMKEAWG